jgi:hypothetical protein
MNFKETINKILEVANSRKTVNEVGYGDIYEHLNSGEHKYPCVFLTVDTVSSNLEVGVDTINGYLYYVDRLTEDNSNKVEIQSYSITILESILNELADIFNSVGMTNITLFTQKFADMCAGGYVEISIGYEANNLC